MNRYVQGTDLIYTYEQLDRWGFGIRIEGIGLAILQPPRWETEAEALKVAEWHMDQSWAHFVSELNNLPAEFHGLGGTPVPPLDRLGLLFDGVETL